MRHALERGELDLHYQSRRDLRGGQITGVEALLRWRHPERGWIPPEEFLPVAEETGLIVPIGRWVLQHACRQAVDWQRAGLPPLPMAVNVAARQLTDTHWLRDLRAALDSSGLTASLLEIEIHESALLGDEQRAAQMLEALRAVGVRVAVDGFGAGYAALTKRQPLPLDTLKISRSYVQGLENQSGERTAAALIALGRNLSATVVAQGVETAAQAERLRARACPELQGFYFQRPMPPEQFQALLERERDGHPTAGDDGAYGIAVGAE